MHKEDVLRKEFGKKRVCFLTLEYILTTYVKKSREHDRGSKKINRREEPKKRMSQRKMKKKSIFVNVEDKCIYFSICCSTPYSLKHFCW